MLLYCCLSSVHHTNSDCDWPSDNIKTLAVEVSVGRDVMVCISVAKQAQLCITYFIGDFHSEL